MSSAQCIVSSRVVIRRESAIRSRISCRQRQLAGANGITVSYALVARSGQENLLRAPGPQIVHEGGLGSLKSRRLWRFADVPYLRDSELYAGG
jgi:hypothetical protein